MPFALTGQAVTDILSKQEKQSLNPKIVPKSCPAWLKYLSLGPCDCSKASQTINSKRIWIFERDILFFTKPNDILMKTGKIFSQGNQKKLREAVECRPTSIRNTITSS